jgi:hypothetical protein
MAGFCVSDVETTGSDPTLLRCTDYTTSLNSGWKEHKSSSTKASRVAKTMHLTAENKAQ